MMVNEIFYSIQGEGIYTGMPMTFIRLTGCNLRCRWCDTAYAYEEGCEISIEEIIEKVESYSCKIVSITGGEPLIQKDIFELVKKLLKNNYTIIIETNGSLDISGIIGFNGVIISLDIKCPSSEMAENNIYKNLEILRSQDMIKFIVNSKEDMIFANDIIKRYYKNGEIIFQPADCSYSLADEFIKSGLPGRFMIQQHKVIWGNKRGV